jgi:hypothetical protein
MLISTPSAVERAVVKPTPSGSSTRHANEERPAPGTVRESSLPWARSVPVLSRVLPATVPVILSFAACSAEPGACDTRRGPPLPANRVTTSDSSSYDSVRVPVARFASALRAVRDGTVTSCRSRWNCLTFR